MQDVSSFDLNTIGPEFIENPHPTLHALRAQAPVHFNRDGSAYLTRYKDVVKVYASRDMLSDKKVEFGKKFGQCPLQQHHTTSLIFNDPPYHTVVRKLISSAFTPRKLAEFEPLIDGIVDRLLDRVQEMADNPNDITGVPTGFYDLDRMTSGMQAGDLLVLAARPSMGKTALAINIAEHVALQEDLPVAVFSMEMGASQLAIRIVGSIGRIDQGRLRTGKLIDDEWPRLSDAIERLKTVSLSIDETPGLTTSELRASARRLARSCGKLGLVVVDYLQLMSGSGGGDGENRATELGEISRGLKMLAKELQCPVIALSQLNRGVEQRTDKRPMMSDLRESGAIEQDADVIMFIYRDDYYNKESKEPGVAEIIIAKQRNGPTGTVKLTFLKPITKFESYAGASSDY